MAPDLSLVPLSGPVTRTAHTCRVAAPPAAAGIAGESTGTGCVLIVDGHGSANAARPPHLTSEPHQIWMGNDSVSDVDREVVARIARTSLRHEEKVP